MAVSAAVMLLTHWVAPAFAAQGLTTTRLAADFAALPHVDDVALSPSGRMIGWIQRGAAGTRAVVYDYSRHRIRRVFAIALKMQPAMLTWDHDSALLLGVDFDAWQSTGPGATYLSLSRVLALNPASGTSRLLLMSGNDRQYVTAAQLLLTDAPRPFGVIMFTYEWSSNAYRSGIGSLIHDRVGNSGWMGNAYAVDPLSGAIRTIGYGDAFTCQWVVSEDGHAVARAECRPRKHRFSLYARQDADWRVVYRRTDGVEPQLLGLSNSGQAILAIMPTRSGTEHLWSIPLDGSAPRDMLAGVKDSVTGVLESYSRHLLGVTMAGPGARVRWIDPAARARYQAVARAFPGRQVSVYDASRNGREVLAEVQGPAAPPVYYLTDFRAHRAMIVGQAYPQLAQMPLGTARQISYRTSAGRDVHATVFLPPRGGRHLPLVVLPPGGPELDRVGSFDWLAQYLAVSGYVVLRPDLSWNGFAGPESSAGTLLLWAGLSQQYALDGVHVLVNEGLVDPRRVGIVGVGYGGYAALAGAAFSPRTYACAVSINGISDLPEFLGYERTQFDGVTNAAETMEFWRTAVGSATDPSVVAASPVRAAGAVRARILMLDSANAGVPVSQSQEMANALAAHGNPATLLRLPPGDQTLALRASRVAVLSAIGPFLHKYLQ